MAPHRRRQVLSAAAVASVLAAIFWLTIDRFQPLPPGVQLWEWCFMCGREWGIDFALNIALFVPLGIVCRLARIPVFPAILGILATSFVIEVLQLVIPQRITSIDDLISNTLGGTIGFLLGGHMRAILVPRARQAAMAVVAAGMFALVVPWGTLWLFEPAPTDHPYWGQFSPVLGQFDRFDGTIIEASVDSEPLRNGRLPNTDAVRRRLRQDSVTVRAVVRGGRATGRLAPVVSIFDGEHNEVMLLGRSGGRSLTFRLRSRASRIGLRTPSVTVWDGFPGAADSVSPTPVHLSGTIDGYSLTAASRYARSSGDTNRVSRTIDFRHTNGWAYLVPFENLYTRHAGRFTTIWLALVFAPLGYYGAVAVVRNRGARPRLVVLLWSLAVVLLALVGLPRMTGLAPAGGNEWLGAAIGLAAGSLAGGALVVIANWNRDSRSGKWEAGKGR